MDFLGHTQTISRMIHKAFRTLAAPGKGDLLSGELEIEETFHFHCLSFWTFCIFNTVSVFLEGREAGEGEEKK